MLKSDLLIAIAVITIGFIIAIATAAGWWFFGGNVGLITGGSHVSVTETEISENAVGPALGHVLWIKTPGGGRGAIRFDRMTNDFGADYTSWYLPPDSPDSLQSATPYHGHVFERYRRTRTSVNSFEVEDIGGDYAVVCGPLSIEWSGSTWLYIPSGYLFAVSKSLSAGIDSDPASLDWHTLGGH